MKLIGEVLNYTKLGNDERTGLLNIISQYAYALDLLDKYDYQTLQIEETSGKGTYRLNHNEAINLVIAVKSAQGNSILFGQEKDKSFMSSLATISQAFDGGEPLAHRYTSHTTVRSGYEYGGSNTINNEQEPNPPCNNTY